MQSLFDITDSSSAIGTLTIFFTVDWIHFLPKIFFIGFTIGLAMQHYILVLHCCYCYGTLMRDLWIFCMYSAVQ